MDEEGAEIDGCSVCCCSGHCLLSHFPGASSKLYDYNGRSNALPTMIDDPWSAELGLDQDQVGELLHDVDELVHPQDEVMQMITALQTQFDMKEEDEDAEQI